VESFVTISGCGTIVKAAASGKEDSSGDGSSGPGASGDDPSGLPNLPNLTKEDANVEQALRELANRRVTTGQILDSSGKVIYREIEAGGSSDLVRRLTRICDKTEPLLTRKLSTTRRRSMLRHNMRCGCARTGLQMRQWS
jgi:hypothetical protein